MDILYLDCASGISGDMVLDALTQIADAPKAELSIAEDDQGKHHGRSYAAVCKMIDGSTASEGAKEIARRIYRAIAEAECSVHDMDLEHAHFHEVGRDEAVLNAVRTGECLSKLSPAAVYCSDIYDGQGTIICSHGEIPVPVPAVREMMKACDYTFKTADVDTELVTPSGLATLIGMGARPCSTAPEGEIIAQATVKGGRDTGLKGLNVQLIRTKI